MKHFNFLVILFLASASSAGPMGRVLYMDGDADYLQLFEPVIDTAPFTIEAWAYMAGPGGGVYNENTIFEQRNAVTVRGGSAIVLHAKNDSLDNATAMVVRDSENYQSSARRPRMPYREWHHYAGVVDSEYVYLYIDGILADKGVYSQSGEFSSDIDHTTIGRHAYHDIVAGYFNGFIDEMRIWNYARSEAEIRDGMHSLVDLEDEAATSHLLAYWRFDDFYEFWKDGKQYVGVKDLSGNEHHGAFVDDAWLKPVDESPRIVPLVEFDLLSPLYGTTVYTDSPTLRWQSATTEEHLLNSELTYSIFLDVTSTFDSPLELTTFGNQNSILASDLQDGVDYYWIVKARNAAGEEKWSTSSGRFHIDLLSNVPMQLPEQFVLWQNYPNPFNPQTTIRFYLPFESYFSLVIYDVRGNVVKTAFDGLVGAGMTEYTWRGEDKDGDEASAGVYFYKVTYQAPGGAQRTLVRKMTLLK